MTLHESLYGGLRGFAHLSWSTAKLTAVQDKRTSGTPWVPLREGLM